MSGNGPKSSPVVARRYAAYVLRVAAHKQLHAVLNYDLNSNMLIGQEIEALALGLECEANALEIGDMMQGLTW